MRRRMPRAISASSCDWKSDGSMLSSRLPRRRSSSQMRRQAAACRGSTAIM
jgi:hypothetical protein